MSRANPTLKLHHVPVLGPSLLFGAQRGMLLLSLLPPLSARRLSSRHNGSGRTLSLAELPSPTPLGGARMLPLRTAALIAPVLVRVSACVSV